MVQRIVKSRARGPLSTPPARGPVPPHDGLGRTGLLAVPKWHDYACTSNTPDEEIGIVKSEHISLGMPPLLEIGTKGTRRWVLSEDELPLLREMTGKLKGSELGGVRVT
jgi:hypothetical protein